MNRSWVFGSISLVALVALACLLAFVIPGTCVTCGGSPQSGCYRAAVLDHVQQVNATSKDRRANIALNLQLYERAADLAIQQGADIVVFPENGIVFGIGSRKDALQFGEAIPNNVVAVCEDAFASSTPILHRLACIAKNRKMLVAANMIDRQPCLATDCPADKQYAFNTAVLFGRDGKLLGKYHKMHPFGEMSLNVPAQDDLVVIDTEIGRLGMQVCFDMIYNKPGVLLASQQKIDTMLFPTWWFNELPFLGASQYQMAWSFGNKINVLASNIHKIVVGSMGSGIYAGAQESFEVVSVADAKARLLVATVPIKPESTAQCPLNAKTLEVPQLVPVPSDVVYRYQTMNLTQNEVVKLDSRQEEVSRCHGGVCCTLNYKIDSATVNPNEGYYLIVTNRTRPGAYPWTEEYCGLVHCPELNKLAPCSLMQSNSPLSTQFSYAQMSGDFSADAYIYPSVIGSEHVVLPKTDLWSHEDVKTAGKSTQRYVLTFGDKSGKGSGHTLATLGLYGRVYSRDPPYKQVPVGVEL